MAVFQDLREFMSPIKLSSQKMITRIQSGALMGLCFFLPLSTAVSTALIAIVLLSWFLNPNIRDKTHHYLQQPLSLVVLLYAGLFIIGCLNSQGSAHDILKSLGKNLKLLILPLIVTLSRDKQLRYKSLCAFLSAVFLTAFLGVIKQSTHFQFWSIRPDNLIFRDKIYTNFLLAFASFILIHISVMYKKPLIKWGALSLSLCFSYLVYFVNRGRTGQLILGALFILIALQKFKLKGLIYGFVTVVGGLVLVLQFQSPFRYYVVEAMEEARYYETGKVADSSIGQRLDLAHGVITLLKERPFLGFGTGSFNTSYKRLADTRGLYFVRNNPHNEYLNISLQLGLFGLAALIALFASAWHATFGLTSLEAWIAQGIILSLSMGCLFNSWLMDFMTGYFFIIGLGLCLGAYEKPVHANDPVT